MAQIDSVDATLSDGYSCNCLRTASASSPSPRYVARLLTPESAPTLQEERTHSPFSHDAAASNVTDRASYVTIHTPGSESQ